MDDLERGRSAPLPGLVANEPGRRSVDVGDIRVEGALRYSFDGRERTSFEFQLK